MRHMKEAPSATAGASVRLRYSRLTFAPCLLDLATMPNTSWLGENVFVSLAAGGHVPVTSDLPCARLDSRLNEILADAAIAVGSRAAGLPDQFLARNRPPKSGCSRRAF